MPGVYWSAVVLISIVGTLITDNLVENFHVTLVQSTIGFAAALAATFAAWYASERTLSIHTIVTRRREAFYWLTILFTFALGTAAGDLVAEQLALGYSLSAAIFAAVIGLITLAHYRFKLAAVPAFWMAYILTRPRLREPQWRAEVPADRLAGDRVRSISEDLRDGGERYA